MSMEIKRIKKIVQEKNVQNAKNLFIDKPNQICTNEYTTTVIKNGGYLIIDFGVEMIASLRVLTFKGNTNVNVRYGESISETLNSIGNKNATNDHATRDFNVYLPNYSDMTLFNSGFRFVRIEALDGDLEIKSIIAMSEIHKQKATYFYKGNDREIKTIFKIAKRTIDVCMARDYVWDGIKRDRLVWVGDMHPEMLSITTLYGKSEKLERSLDFCRNSFPLPNWMNGLSSYSLWWIIILSDYIERTNRIEYLKEQKEYLVELVKQLSLKVNSKGEMSFENYFTDWPTCTDELAPEGQRAISIVAMQKAKKLFSILGLDSKICVETEEKFKKKEINCYGRKQLIGLKYLALKKISEEEKRQLIEGGAKGLSTFMSYYILTAIASFDKQKAIEIMKEYYMGMVKMGATTFWEDFDIDWTVNAYRIDQMPKKNKSDVHGDYGAFCYKQLRHSLCHGWSSGVIAFIKEFC